MKKVIANDNVIIQDKVIDIYLENENIYVSFYSNKNYNIYKNIYIFESQFNKILCNIISKSICKKTNLLLYKCMMLNDDTSIDIRDYMNIEIGQEKILEFMDIVMAPGFSDANIIVEDKYKDLGIFTYSEHVPENIEYSTNPLNIQYYDFEYDFDRDEHARLTQLKKDKIIKELLIKSDYKTPERESSIKHFNI